MTRLPVILALWLASLASVHAQAPAQETADFWRDQNIYQVLTDRFYNGDPGNDNASGSFNPQAPKGVHGGDFRGLEQKLDYIRALGATAIWISPIVLNATGEYHGYAGRDFYQIDPHWGTLADLQSLTAAAHARGLLVICDVVTNHGGDLINSSGSGYPNFLSPPSAYTLKLRNSTRAYAAPFHLSAANPTLASLFHGQGNIADYNNPTQTELGELSGLDDFRTELPYVQQAMGAIYRHWIEQAGFDGFRIDTVKHVDLAFWRAWTPNVRSGAAAAGKPRFFFFGEVYDGNDGKCGSYTGTRAGQAEFLLDSVLDFPLYYRAQNVFARANAPTGQLEERYGGLSNYAPSAQNALVTFLDSHDVPRFLNASNASGNTARLRLALAFLYTSRGIPNLYYGTEQNFSGGADPANREDMFAGVGETGPAVGDNFNQTSAQFLWVAQLNNLRRLHPALRRGEHVNLWANFGAPGLFAYARRLGSEELFVVFNTASVAQTLPPRPTIHAPGTVLVNLLDPREELTVDVAGQIPAQDLLPLGVKIFTAKSAAQPLAPVVVSIAPAHDARSVTTHAPVVLRFSRPMNRTLTQGAFSTVPAAPGTFTWSAASDELTWTPAGLATNTTYAVKLAASARDAEPGNEMHAPFEARFLTGTAAFPSLPPTATTDSASAVQATTALLAGSVNPNGTPTSVSFEYGPTASYGSTTAAQAIGAGTGAVAVSAGVSGLAPATTWHFRTVGTNANGTVRGADQTFTTLPQLASVVTEPATDLTTGGATLRGTVQPFGSPAAGWFEYGPTTAYGSSTRKLAADDAEAYSGWNFGAQSGGGLRLGPAVTLESTGGGLFLADPAGGRQIDGVKSFGVYAGSGAQALTRALLDASGAGTLQLTVRFDVDNATGFSGLSLRSGAGQVFADFDLLSLGLQPATGHETLVVRGAVEQTLSLGTDLRGALVDLQLDYDAPSGTYALGAKLRTSAEFSVLRGNLRLTAPAVSHLGFATFNSGDRQDLIFDSMTVLQSPSLGAGQLPVALQEVVSGLVPGAIYHYRAVARNASGLSYGEDRTFVAAPLSALEQWRLLYFGTTDRFDPQAGDAADPDRDGLGNLLEYLLGTDPKQADFGRRPQAGTVEQHGIKLGTITFRRPQAARVGAILRIETTADLTGAWSALHPISDLVGVPLDLGDGTELVTYRSPLEAAHVFLRLRAE